MAESKTKTKVEDKAEQSIDQEELLVKMAEMEQKLIALQEESKDKEARKTIQEVRAEGNGFTVIQSKTFPSLFAITREKGRVPNDISGDYTSQQLAEEAINTYLKKGS